jgi:hypothetical protein
MRKAENKRFRAKDKGGLAYPTDLKGYLEIFVV